MLSDIISDAKKMNPQLKLVEQLKFYSVIQDKIIKFSSNFNMTDVAFSKNQLAKLIIDAFEPDLKWELGTFVEYN